MHGREFCVQINSLRGQTDMADYVSLRDQRQMMHVTLPSLDEQKAIAHILGTLDDKIELNQQMNHTLESIARALFKSWFIDFDPVRAKMDGRQPAGMDAETAALFPEEFEDSPLGKIPRGWKVQTLSDLSEISSGKRPSERSSELTAEMPIQLFGGGGVMAYVKAPLYQEPILLTGRVGTLGLVFRISSPCWASDNTLVVVPKENWNYEFLYFQLKEIRFESLNRGSTQPLVTQGDLKKQKFVVPHIRLLQEFHRRTSLLYKRLEVNIVETESLTSIRDALLPKLLSGEIRIKDPEKVVEQELSIVTG
jgi:type I restriction enzyme S subunit